MFGYHNSNRCSTDLWSPVITTSIENRAFSAYAFHTQQLDDIAAQIATGEGSISVPDDITEEDLAYIEDQLRTRYGIEVTLNFD